MQLYKNESSDPKTNAQRNLCMRTHYVDDATLRFHKSRVLSARHAAGGLLFCIVTSDALDYENRSRGFRYAIFDLFGHVLERPKLEEAFRRSETCAKALWAAVSAIDAVAVTLEAAMRAERQHAVEMAELRGVVAKLQEVKAA